ncbi:hypothetical protein [Flavobacterium sp.]|uniref:hypothetical protein n=1 Tax=Flavobacterium sp. TaxID=239 RepID=UPI0037519290
MKPINYLQTFIIILIIISCAEKKQKTFNINLPYYSNTIELDRTKNYDTLIVWNWYNDNSSNDYTCYRIQNSKLGIVMERGMLPKKAEYYDQMTIKTPIKSFIKNKISTNKITDFKVNKWLSENKELHLSERPIDIVFKFDSIIIANKKFGVFGIKIIETETKIIYMTNIEDQSIEFEFRNNFLSTEKLYLQSLEMMNTIKIKHYR